VFNDRRLIKGILFAAFIAIIFLPPFFFDTELYFTGQVSRWLTDAGALAPVIYMVIMALAVIISPIPSMPLDITAGAFFGPVMGTLYSAIGATVGALIAFLIARVIGRELVERLIGGHINFCTRCSDMVLTKIILLSRLIPFVSFDLVSYGAGLTRVSPGKFVLATFIGMLPLTFVYNYFGSSIVIGRGTQLIFGLVMVLAFFLIPRVIEKTNLFSLRDKLRH
jgi:uncharacterized membrane protein YdjX (TVP38/TMEM64 family)